MEATQLRDTDRWDVRTSRIKPLGLSKKLPFLRFPPIHLETVGWTLDTEGWAQVVVA